MPVFKKGVKVRQVRHTDLVVKVEAETEEEAEAKALQVAGWFCLQAREEFQLGLEGKWEDSSFEVIGPSDKDVERKRTHIDDTEERWKRSSGSSWQGKS